MFHMKEPKQTNGWPQREKHTFAGPIRIAEFAEASIVDYETLLLSRVKHTPAPGHSIWNCAYECFDSFERQVLLGDSWQAMLSLMLIHIVQER